jgi:uncharacterized protein (TIGR02996 family)
MSTAPERGLLSAILEDPGDDTPRLILADWLDDHDQPRRAEFIRAQIEADKLDASDPRRTALEDRADELLAGHIEEWLGPVGSQTSRWRFRRGFVEYAAVECERFPDVAEEMFASWPLRHLRLQGTDGDYAENDGIIVATRSPWLARLAGLTVYCDADSLSNDAVAALVDCPHLANLRELDLNGHDPGQGIGPAGVRLLVASPHLRNLTSLRLRWQQIGDDGARVLAGSQLLARLNLLDLGAIQEMTDAGLIALVSSPSASALKWLNVEQLGPGPEAMDALVAWGERARPTGLFLASLSDESARRLGRATWLGGLREAGMNYPPDRLYTEARLETLHGSSPAFAAEVGAGTRFDSLRALDFSHSDLHVSEIRRMIASESLGRLASLDLFFSGLRDAGMAELAGSSWLTRLRHLNVRFGHVTTTGVKALADSPHATGLRSLYLSGNELGAPGVRALARSPHLTGLRYLDLCGVKATDASVAALCESFPYLRWLDLSENKLTDTAAASLCQARWPLLERLTLCHLTLGARTRAKLRKRWGPRVEFATQDEWL